MPTTSIKKAIVFDLESDSSLITCPEAKEPEILNETRSETLKSILSFSIKV